MKGAILLRTTYNMGENRMRDAPYITSLISCYFVALGVLVGGAIIGGIGSFLVGDPPLTMMSRLAKSLKIWALVAAIGGTFEAIESFERGLFYGSPLDVFKQILLIITAMGGAHTGSSIISWLTQEQNS